MDSGGETGAIAAATYFITELYPYTHLTQDTAPLRAVSHPECKFCESTMTSVENLRTAGQLSRPGEMAVSSAAIEASKDDMYEVRLASTLTPDELWSRDGVLLDVSGPEEIELSVFVIWSTDHWILRGVDAITIDGSPA